MYLSLTIYHLRSIIYLMNHEQLEERLKKFALRVLKLVKSLPKTEENRIYGRQVIRSSSSIGANYVEAVYSHSLQDFLHSVNISRKESAETLYWLELIYSANKPTAARMLKLLDENKQLLKIFISSIKTAKKNDK